MKRNHRKPHTLGSYADCWPLLDTALAHGGARIPVGHAGKAIMLRHRMYRARKLLQQKAEEAVQPGQHATTSYDCLVIKLVPHTAKGAEPADLAIEVKAPEAGMLEGMTDLEGNPLGAKASDALAEAKALKDRLGLE